MKSALAAPGRQTAAYFTHKHGVCEAQGMRVDSTFGFVALQPPDWRPNDAEMAEELKKKASLR